MKLCISLDI